MRASTDDKESFEGTQAKNRVFENAQKILTGSRHELFAAGVTLEEKMSLKENVGIARGYKALLERVAKIRDTLAESKREHVPEGGTPMFLVQLDTQVRTFPRAWKDFYYMLDPRDALKVELQAGALKLRDLSEEISDTLAGLNKSQLPVLAMDALRDLEELLEGIRSVQQTILDLTEAPNKETAQPFVGQHDYDSRINDISKQWRVFQKALGTRALLLPEEIPLLLDEDDIIGEGPVADVQQNIDRVVAEIDAFL